jgi:XTP/dITP diphosphohydrolase
MRPLLIASTNQGKVKEIQAYLKGLPYSTISLSDLSAIPEVVESGNTFDENALLKAKTIAQKTGYLTLSDDSGLVVDALNGRPGVYSARYGKDDGTRINKLLEELKPIIAEERTARFICAIALHDPQSGKTHTVSGTVEGLITDKPMGSNGFGYDPIFYSQELKKTFAESSMAEKNTVSHRARALKQIRQILLDLINPGILG